MTQCTALEPLFRKKTEDAFDVRFCYRRGNRTYFGSGRTRSLTGQVIYFESDQEIPPGANLEMRIDCISDPRRNIPAALLVDGRVIHPGGSVTVLEVTRLEIRMCGTRSFDPPEMTGQLLTLTA